MNSTPKMLIGIGVLFILAGLLFGFFGKIPFIGKLPGDIYIRKENFSFYFPFMTCLLISLVLTALFRLFGKR